MWTIAENPSNICGAVSTSEPHKGLSILQLCGFHILLQENSGRRKDSSSKGESSEGKKREDSAKREKEKERNRSSDKSREKEKVGNRLELGSKLQFVMGAGQLRMFQMFVAVFNNVKQHQSCYGLPKLLNRTYVFLISVCTHLYS